MKREVAFFKDKRGLTAKALLETMRALGMTDDEIKSALLEFKQEQERNEYQHPVDDAKEQG